MSASAVLEALRETPKGRLSYGSQWEHCSSVEKLRMLHELTSPPPLSPEALKYLAERAKRLSLENGSTAANRHTSTPHTSTHHTPIPHTSTPHTCIPLTDKRGDSPSTSTATARERTYAYYSPVVTVSMATTEGSPIGRITQELEECEQSLDDKMMEEVKWNTECWMMNFKKEREDIREKSRAERLGRREVEMPRLKAEELQQVCRMATTEGSPIGRIIQELEECEQSLDDKMMEEVKWNTERWMMNFKKEREGIREKSRTQRERERAERLGRREVEMARLKAEELQHQQEVMKMMEALRENSRQHEEMIEAKLRTGEEQKMEILRRTEERRKKAAERLEKQCQELREDATKLLRQFTALYRGCKYPQFMPKSAAAGHYESAIVALRSVQESLQAQEQSGNPEPAQVELQRAQLTGLLPALAELKTAVEEANQWGEREEKERARLLEQAAQKLQEEQESKQQEARKVGEGGGSTQEAPLEQEPSVTTTTAVTSVGDKVASKLGMPKSMVEVYNRLQTNLSKALNLCNNLTSTKDPQLKKFRFDLQKAVSIPVNAISTQSGEHLMDKITRLRRLLSGQPVEVTGRSLSISQHPEAKLYCCNLLAKKLVKQGEQIVKVETAFPTAAVMVGVWSEFPEIGDLILAHFYSSCPVLVPFYIPRKEGISEAEHMKLQGYEVSKDDTVESEEFFLKRMGGIMRLYAAVIQTELPNRPHPHGLEHGWAWLAHMLNMEPHPTVTATALFGFLEIAGHVLMKKYGRQFRKLLFVLCKEYIQKIERVTPPAQLGPLSRLTQFLEECVATGRIPEPKGRLTQEFWRTRSHGVTTA